LLCDHNSLLLDRNMPVVWQYSQQQGRALTALAVAA
jgi:hypothetical protein